MCGWTENGKSPSTKRPATHVQAWSQPEPAAAAVICFEWLQRPENVLAGYLRWSDYRSAEWPSAIKNEHHKTGAVVWHPLEDGDGTFFYSDAEEVLAKLPRRGVPMILRQVSEGVTKPYSFNGMQKIVSLDARRAWVAVNVHARRLSTRWHD
jgi:hypothetical protein